MIQPLKTLRSFKYALKGLAHFFQSENNARAHLIAGFAVSAAGFYFQISRTDWLWIALAMTLVFVAEIFNTAIEKTMDLLHPEKNSAVARIKDLAAGAVLLTALFAVIVGVMIFKPYFAM